MPRASSSISSESPSQSGKPRWALPGSRCVRRRRAGGRRARPRCTRRTRSSRRRGHPLGVLRLRLDGVLDRGREAGDGRHVEGAAADVALLAAAVEQRGRATSSRRSTSAPTPYGPPSLCPVRVSASTPLAAKSTGTAPTACTASVCTGMPWAGGDRDDLLDRLERADLVVGPHHRDQRRPTPGSRSTAARKASTSRRPRAVDRQQLDLGAAPPRPSQSSASSTAWCSIDEARIRTRARVGVAARPEEALEREVVGLGAAGGEHHLARPAVERLRDGLARLLDDPPRGPAAGVERRRVADVARGGRSSPRRAAGSIGVVAAWSR